MPTNGKNIGKQLLEADISQIEQDHDNNDNEGDIDFDDTGDIKIFSPERPKQKEST